MTYTTTNHGGVLDDRLNSSDYQHPRETNLLNLHKAMQYRDGTNPPEPEIRVNVGNGFVISGNVNIPGTVTVASSPEDPVHVHITEIGTSGNLLANNISYMPIGGNVTAFQGNIPWLISNTNATVSGTVAVSSISSNVTVVDGGGSLTVDGNLNATITGGNVSISSLPDSAVSAWQEPYGITPTPVIQYDASYGLTTLIEQNSVLISNIGNGNVSANNSVFVISSGNVSGDLATIRSTRHMPYRAGQGSVARFTAAFTANVANSVQRAGMTNGENLYMFGYDGATYGIWHGYNGKNEIRQLTIETAPTGTQTANITLNNTSYLVPIHAGTTANTAAAIAAYPWPQTWQVDQIAANVIFTALNPGPRSGTYAFSSSGTGTLATGSYTTLQAGQARTQELITPASWNGAPLPASFDPTDLNVYQINFKWLGAGSVRFSLENPDTGLMQTVHTLKWVSSGNTFPHTNKPNMRIGWSAAAQGTLAAPAVIRGVSAMGAIEGIINITQPPISIYSADTSTRAQNQLWHLLSIRNPNTKFNLSNTQEVVLDNISFSFQGNDPVTVFLFLNAKANDLLIYNTVNTTSLLKSITQGVTIDLNTYTPSVTFTAPVTGSADIDLRPYRLILPPGQAINVGFQSTGQVTRTAVSLTTTLNS